MTQTIADKQAEIVSEFQSLSDWQERYRRIIKLGKALEPLDDAQKTDDNKVKGCQSQVWLVASLDGDKIMYKADSDAAIVKGLIALLTRAFSGHRPDEILAAPPSFVDELGLNEHLSQSRSNGLSAMIKQIKFYALAFKAIVDRASA